MDDDQFFSKYDEVNSQTLSRYRVPGISIAVIDNGITRLKAYGISRYPGDEATSKTLYDAASMTKAQISAAMSLLVDDESFPDVQWKTPVSRLIRDDFVLSDAQYTDMVTLEDILSHRSGVPDMDEACYGVHAEKPDTVKSVVRKFRHLPIAAPIRTKNLYCNMMYVVAVHIIETLTGEWMGDFLRKRIWEPLGMNETYWGHDQVIACNVLQKRSIGYGWDEEKSEPFEIPWPKQPEAAGAGEIITTAGDHAKFVSALIHKTGPFSEAAHKELVKPRSILDEYEDPPIPFTGPTLYALGWCVETYHGDTVVSHSGGTNGFGCITMFLPRLKWGIVIMSNSDGGSASLDRICYAMIDDLLEVPQEKRHDWDARATKWLKEEEPKIEELYPTVPNPPIPLSLPLTAYTGRYKDDGFGDYVVDLKDGKLTVDCTDRTWRNIMTFEHVSGEFFAAWAYDIESRFKRLFKAQFHVGPDGSADQLGVNIIADMEDHIVWFTRVEEERSREVKNVPDRTKPEET